MTIARDSYFGTEYPIFVARMRPDAHWSDMTVKQGHADYCRAYGHDVNGLIVDGCCMRCGEMVADGAPSAPADVRAAERARDDARAALSAAEGAAEGAYMGSDEWYAVADAERTLSAAERALSRARNALARAERAGAERAAAARYAREAEHDRFMSTVRPAIYGQR